MAEDENGDGDKKDGEGLTRIDVKRGHTVGEGRM